MLIPDLVPWGNKPLGEPMPTQVYDTIYCSVPDGCCYIIQFAITRLVWATKLKTSVTGGDNALFKPVEIF